jgi:SAM-dependent methyltransferase
VADLRALRRRPELEASLWRSPELVALTYGRMWGLVAEQMPPAPARVLDVGCGPGALCLELARAGHDVTGIDADRTAIELAERGAAAAGPGRVTYLHADVHDWDGDETAFDVVVSTLALHHLADPAAALGRMRGWLRPGGRLVCVDFLHDRFDRRAARWLAQVRGLLEATGAFAPDGRLPADPEAAIDRIEWEWEQDHAADPPLNGAELIEEPLGRLFRTELRSWHPYLYWDVLLGLDLDYDARAEKATARLVAAWEANLLATGELPPLMLRFVGTR